MFEVEYLVVPAIDAPHWVPAGRPVWVIAMLEVPLVTETELKATGKVTFRPLIVMDPDEGEAAQPIVVEIPGPSGPAVETMSLAKMIQEAVGVRVE